MSLGASEIYAELPRGLLEPPILLTPCAYDEGAYVPSYGMGNLDFSNSASCPGRIARRSWETGLYLLG